MSEADDTERWLPVRGFEGFYEVSSLGRVRSVDRTITSRNRWGAIEKRLKGRTIAPGDSDSYGYLTVGLSRNGRHRPYRVHLLVVSAFLGARPKGMNTLHGPGGRHDNSVANLRYGTRAENEQDKIRDGTFNHGGDVVFGERNGNSRLTEAEVTEIRHLYQAGRQQAELARLFRTTQANVYLIVQRKTWRHVP